MSKVTKNIHFVQNLRLRFFTSHKYHNLALQKQTAHCSQTNSLTPDKESCLPTLTRVKWWSKDFVGGNLLPASYCTILTRSST